MRIPGALSAVPNWPGRARVSFAPVVAGLALQLGLLVAAPAGAEEADASSEGLQQIVVTAERRGENLQKVPITVSAITAQDAKIQGIEGTSDLQNIVPGLTMEPQFGVPLFYLRGVGTQNITGGNETSVATYVDGIYIADMPGTLFAFNNIERVEVLKGPQGTLFGRNATGGLIQVVTRDPGFEPHLDVSAGYGNFQTTEAQVYGTAGLADAVAGDVAIYYHDQAQGWGTNIFNGSNIYQQHDFGARTKELWKIGSDTQVRLSLDYSRNWSSLSEGREFLPGAFGSGHTPYTGNFYNTDTNQNPYDLFEAGGAGLFINHDFGWSQLESLTSYRRDRFYFQQDQDGTPLPLIYALIRYYNHDWTQEFKLQSADGSRVNWTGGLFFFDATNTLNPGTFLGSAFTALGGQQLRFADQKTTSYSAYGQATMPLLDNTKLTTGIRFTQDRREFDGYFLTPVQGVNSAASGDKTWGRWTWRAALDQQLGSDALAFLSYNRGFKSGVFNLLTPTNPAVNPEILDAYELGAKTEWLDHRLRLNASTFLYKYKNMQLSTQQLGVSYVLNAAAATLYGVDLDLLFKPINQLTLRTGAEWLHSRYDSFPNAPTQIPSPALCTPIPHSTGAPTGGNTTCAINAAGNALIGAPDATVNVGANYLWPLGWGDLNADVSYYYNSGMFFQPDDRLKQGAFGVFNSALELALGGGRYDVRLWAKNLGGEKYYAFLATSVGDTGTPAPPRTYGLTVEMHF